MFMKFLILAIGGVLSSVLVEQITRFECLWLSSTVHSYHYLLAVVGLLFTGSEKKARTFDFMAMFQEARKTAIERTQATQGILYYSHIFSFSSDV